MRACTLPVQVVHLKLRQEADSRELSLRDQADIERIAERRQDRILAPKQSPQNSPLEAGKGHRLLNAIPVLAARLIAMSRNIR